MPVEPDKMRLPSCPPDAAFPECRRLETVKNPVRFTTAAADRDRVMQGARMTSA
jgi:hypothetical protein